MDRPPHVTFGAAVLLVSAMAIGGGILLANRGGQPVDTGGPGAGVAVGETEVRYRLLEAFKPLFFCDPDFSPVGSEEGERANANKWWAEADHNGDEVTTIRKHTGLVGGELTAPSVLRVYREHKRLRAVMLEPAKDRFRFQMSIGTETEGFRVTGSVGRDGTVRESLRQPSMVSCPICLAGRTLIDTPRGPVRVADLRVGMSVWTIDASGRRVAGTIARTIRRPVATPHEIIRLTLADGRAIAASPAHPMSDGRPFATLAIGELVDGSRIVAITIEQSTEPYTYDLLPGGTTGAYWADGVLVGSTLAGALDLAS